MHVYPLYFSTCAPFVGLDYSGSNVVFQRHKNFLGLLCLNACLSAFPFIFQVYVFHIHSRNIIECCTFRSFVPIIKSVQLSATDLLALASMKNAAKCDK